MVETQFCKKIKTLRSDNGTEFIMKDFFAKKCILHHLICVETPQQNASSALSNQIPFEVLFGHPPSYAHLKVFGCLCFASTLSNHRSKFAPRARDILLGLKDTKFLICLITGCSFLGMWFSMKILSLLLLFHLIL